MMPRILRFRSPTSPFKTDLFLLQRVPVISFRENQTLSKRWSSEILQGLAQSFFRGQCFLFNFRAEIYYQTMNVVTLKQDPKYTVSWAKSQFQLMTLFIPFQLQSLFGALGGGLSLYLGVAVVMLFELIELLIDLVFAFICGSEDGKVWDKLRKPFSDVQSVLKLFHCRQNEEWHGNKTRI